VGFDEGEGCGEGFGSDSTVSGRRSAGAMVVPIEGLANVTLSLVSPAMVAGNESADVFLGRSMGDHVVIGPGSGSGSACEDNACCNSRIVAVM
jgi:hypothetical protein